MKTVYASPEKKHFDNHLMQEMFNKQKSAFDLDPSPLAPCPSIQQSFTVQYWQKKNKACCKRQQQNSINALQYKTLKQN